MDQVLIRDGSSGWREPSTVGYTDEAALQQLLAEHPTLLPGVVGGSAVCVEFQSGVGPADIVIVDGEASITLVECKLAANRQVRREVIGQVLDYASRLWKMPLADFVEQWAARNGTPFDELFGDVVEAGLETLAENLRAGRFRIILAVDAINDDLMRIVSYLNAMTNSETSVVAVEFRRMTHGDTEILMPRTFGMELAQEKASSRTGSRQQWTVDEYLGWCRENDPDAEAVVQTMLDTFAERGWFIGGGRAATPSVNLSTEVAGLGKRWPITFYTYPSSGAQVEVRYSDFKTHPDAAESLVARTVDAFPLGLDATAIRSAGYAKRPNFLAHRITVDQARLFADAVADWACDPVSAG